MKISKTRFFIILAIGVALVLGTSYLFMALAQTEKSEPAVPSTAAIAPQAPSIVATSPTPPPGEPEKPPPPTHYGPKAKQAVISLGAYSLATTAAAKPDKVEGYSPPQRSYEGVVVLEGGETCDDAVVISVPHNSTGYTCDNNDDYEEQYVFDCPYSSTSPDVVYSYTPSVDQCVDIDLGGSSYDTKLWVYENTCESGYVVGCNDDYYADYTSAIFGLDLYAGNTYYIVVDGYGGDCGDYLLNVTECVVCDVVCPPGGVDEGEPICEDDWEDIWNGGCNSEGPPYPFGDLNCGDTICGTSGVYDYYGTAYREMDWFRLELTGPATLTWSAVAEFPVALWIIDAGSEDCVDYVSVAFNYTYTLCDTLSISADVPAGVYWFIIAPPDWGDYPCGVEYVAWLDCDVITTGACCNDFEPYDCQITTPEDCAALPDHTFMGLGTDCDPNPCLPSPDNDECEGAIEVFPPDCPSVYTEYGTTVGATVDCPGVLDWEAVWYKFELTYACNNVLIDYCPTNRDDVYTRGVVLYDECPADCPNYILYTGLQWVTCPSGYTDLTVWWNALPAGTYWLPVFVEDASGNQLDFGFDICVEECFPEPGDNCADPIVVDLNKSGPGDTLYADYSQTTCGRVDDYENTCLGYYDGGEDIIYQVNVTTAVDVNIKMDPKGTTWGGIAVDVACPPGDPCMASATGSSGPYLIMGLHLEPGTYYIMVDTWPSPDCIPDFDLFIIEATGPTPGDNCSDPALVTLPAEMPYTDINYTCGRVDDYENTCLGYYDGGEDKIYEVTVTSDVAVQITLDPYGTTYTGIALDASCPPGDPCMYYSTNSGSGAHGFIASLSAGTYYIMVDTWPSPDCIPEFELEIIEAPEAPENDTCQGAPVISTFPTTVFGTTVGATIDCPGVLDWDAVWYRFDVPYASNDIFVDFCPTDGYIATVGVVMYDECPPDCPNYILRTGYQWVTCPSGYDNPQIWWNDMPGPASYWFPVYVEPGKGAMDFGFEVSVEEAIPCTLVCPPGGYDEGEGYCYDDYDDTYNVGCNGSPFVFQEIACGDTICGSCGVFDFFGSTYRDMDWFEVQCSEGDITLTCVAEFPLALWLFDPVSFDCVDMVNLDFINTTDVCDTLSVSAYVPSGTYWLIIAPMDWGNYPCGPTSEYVAWVECQPFGPQIAVDPSSMYPVLNPSGDCSTADEDLVISSEGGEDLDYSIVENPAVDWMELSSYSGTIPPGDSHTLTVSFDANGMAPGDYYCDLEITHNDPGIPSPFVVTVHLEVELAPEIGLPIRLTVPVIPDCETVYPLRIANSGEGTLDFEISVSSNPPAAAKNNIQEALETLRQAGRANPELTPREAYKTLGAKKSAIEYHSTGSSEGLLLSAGAGKQATILLVDDDGGLPGGTYTDVEYAYMDALDANALIYDYYVVDWTDPLSPGPDLATMQNYSCVIWFTGETWGYYGDDTVTPTDESNLAAFLDGGGNLFLSAEDYLWDRYPSAGSFSPGQFPYDYLHLESVCQDCILDPYVVYGVTGSVAEGMQFDGLRCWNDPGVALWTDYLYTQTGGVDVFSVNLGDPSAIQYDADTYKIVFTTTAFPGLVDGSPSYRADLMASIMDWFGCGGGPACPFTVDPEAGEVPPESFFDVSLIFDGTLFEECVEETMTCYLSVASNDCDEPLLTVDIHALSARGDVTGDCVINVADAVFLLNYAFEVKGPPPDPMCIGDVDRDGDVDSDDAMYLISYLFEYGPPPEIPTAPLDDQTPIQLK